MKLDEILKEEDKQSLFMITVRGNFYGGKYYETGLDSMFVLASSKEEALKIGKDNVSAVEKHFRAKKYVGGKMAIAKKDTVKFTEKSIATAKSTTQKKHGKVLHSDGTVKPADISG